MIEEAKPGTFNAEIFSVVNGIVQKYAPQKLILIEVDSWFGSNWLGFSGKIMGRLGVWTEPLSVPPFGPARIFSQRRFISPDYTETDAGDRSI